MGDLVEAAEILEGCCGVSVYGSQSVDPYEVRAIARRFRAWANYRELMQALRICEAALLDGDWNSRLEAWRKAKALLETGE